MIDFLSTRADKFYNQLIAYHLDRELGFHRHNSPATLTSLMLKV
jgi:hypothetical protein